jgi:DNA-binding NarL/FixJ family response regulator
MGITPVRILIVDDYEPWRQFLRVSLLADERLQVVGEAVDGLEAIQKGRELQPDLIILDIGLPAMNGIEAARTLREVSPRSRVVFVSSNRSLEILHEALQLGATGYVLKSDAGAELLPALAAALEGKQYVSQSVLDPAIVDRAQPRTRPPIAARNVEGPRFHEAVFCSEERVLLDRATSFIGNALKSGNAAVVLATEAHRKMILGKVQELGIDVNRAIEQGRYLSFDAEEALATFMLNGAIDPSRMLTVFHSVITTASGSGKGRRSRVWVFGECVHLLWERGNPEAAIQMERLGNELARKYDLEILCAYLLAQGRMHPEIHRLICEQHSAVYTA